MSEKELENWEEFVEEEGVGCILEVDLEYPAELHDFHNDFPLAPEKMILGKVEKLTQNLRDKEKMVLHGKNLQLYLSLGMKTEIDSERIEISGERFHEKLYRQKYFPEISGEKTILKKHCLNSWTILCLGKPWKTWETSRGERGILAHPPTPPNFHEKFIFFPFFSA